jgi:DNA repair photolyase
MHVCVLFEKRRGLMRPVVTAIDQHLIWTDARVFISPSLGCPAKCQFCYLPEVGLLDVENAPAVNGSEVARKLLADARYVPGRRGTVLSLGCLSECLSPNALPSTLHLLRELASTRNRVQLATRWFLTGQPLIDFLSVVQPLNITVFHSTIEPGAKHLELGTPGWPTRLSFMERLAHESIPNVLYIKPYIMGYTSRFLDTYVAAAIRCKIDAAVVGRLFRTSGYVHLEPPHNSSAAPVYEEIQFPVGKPSITNTAVPEEVQQFQNALRSAGLKVFEHSLDALPEVRHE